jgi:hypothetical protein
MMPDLAIQILAIAVLAVLIAWGVLLLIRRYVWWYLGIDRALEHLASIDNSLRQLPAVRRHDQEIGRLPPETKKRPDAP